jgi:hypothetical protein
MGTNIKKEAAKATSEILESPLFLFTFNTAVAITGLIRLLLLRCGLFATLCVLVVVRLAGIRPFKSLIALVAAATPSTSFFVIIASS